MVQDPSASGGGAIYKDGDPVVEILGGDEILTVPDGETWVVTVTDNGGSEISINDTGVADVEGFEAVLEGGDEISTEANSGLVTGWSL